MPRNDVVAIARARFLQCVTQPKAQPRWTQQLIADELHAVRRPQASWPMLRTHQSGVEAQAWELLRFGGHTGMGTAIAIGGR